ncbi:hypothetical protein [uncultured Corynebacterium sp.]|uniref:hypothetical protein n=1 Tax=uncultured Corynebacterium sp. TaxID=159447 RepID=UPI00259A9497|nr:hypothetical protein [uncultured Corynebacterium sp.]
MTHRNPHDPSNGDLGNGEGGQNNADLTAANEHNRATRELAEKRAAEIRAKARERAAQAQKAAEPAPVPRVSEEAAHEDTARADTAREEPRAQRVTAQPVPKQAAPKKSAPKKSTPQSNPYVQPEAEKQRENSSSSARNPFLPPTSTPHASPATGIGHMFPDPAKISSEVGTSAHWTPEQSPVNTPASRSSTSSGAANTEHLKPRKRLVGLLLAVPLTPLPMLGMHHFYFRRPFKGIIHIAMLVLAFSRAESSLGTYTMMVLAIWILVSFCRIMSNTKEYREDGKGVYTEFF